jgi:hypothetical protein
MRERERERERKRERAKIEVIHGDIFFHGKKEEKRILVSTVFFASLVDSIVDLLTVVAGGQKEED